MSSTISDPTDILSTLSLPSHLLAYLSSLHTKSLDQESAIDKNATAAIKARYPSDPEGAKREMDELMRDKYIALDADKCVFIYNLLLSIGARTVVEVGTSFGVSTIYLALAVSEVAKRDGGTGRVVATEKEGSKIAVARETWKKADPEGGLGIEKAVELREGDLEQTLEKDVEGEVDFVLLDIWPYVALPALKLLMPKMRPGAVVVTDNVVMAAAAYQDLFEVLRDPRGDFRSMTLPYSGGLEMSVYWPVNAK